MKKRESELPDVGTDDANALEYGEEDGSLELSSSGEANGHEGPTRAEVVNGLGITRGAGGSDDGGVSAESAGDTLDVPNEVLSLLEVDPSLGTKAEDEVLLLVAGI